MSRRHRFTILTVIVAVLLMSWGAFVTSIDAGLAVPDWPKSFNSYDPFNPLPGWWTMTPVLAEHGHRLLGALVGLLTMVLALWTIRSDERRWMRWLGGATLLLVILQGLLGGLRVVLVSLDLAVVHACVAQIFFSTLVAMAVFTSRSWQTDPPVDESSERGHRLRRFTVATAVVIFVQIILGALLRHPGTGIDLAFAGVHIFWAFVVVALVVTTARMIPVEMLTPAVRRTRNGLVFVLAAQFALGLTAFFVLLDEAGIVRPSAFQVVANSAHMVIGAILMATAVALAVYAHRGAVSERSGVSTGVLHPAG